MILNLTQHEATPDQIAAGVVEPADKAAVQAALTFDTLPHPGQVHTRAETLAQFARMSGCRSAMIGGAPFLMAELDKCLLSWGVRPLYAFSVRVSTEQIQPDGSVRKVATFQHAGFVGLEFSEVDE